MIKHFIHLIRKGFILTSFNLQNPPVHFKLDNLTEGVYYRILVSAVNDKGSSEPITFDGIVYRMNPNNHSKQSLDSLTIELSPYLAGLAVVGAMVLVLSCCVLSMFHLRKTRK